MKNKIILSILASTFIVLIISMPTKAAKAVPHIKHSTLVFNAKIHLRPYPKVWMPQKGEWIMPDIVTLAVKGQGDQYPVKLLSKKLANRYGVKVKTISDADNADIKLTYAGIRNDLTYAQISKKKAKQGFILNVTPKHIHIQAGTGQGMYYGVRALLQLIHLSSMTGGTARAKAVHCEDWPTVTRRIVFHMMHPYNHPYSIKAYKDFIYNEVAGGRYNTLIIISRWTYPYKSHPEIGISKYKWTRKQWQNVLGFAEKNYVNVIPGLEGPGHAGYITGKFPDIAYPGAKGTLDPTNSKAIALFKDLCNDLIDLYKPFDPKFFFIGTDEVKFPPAKDPEKTAARKFQFLHFIKEIGSYVQNKGLRPVIWDDMLSHNGGAPYNVRRIIPKIPRNFVIAPWVSFPVWPNQKKPLGHTENPVSQYRELGFHTLWRILTAFYRTNVNHAVNWETAWDGVGIFLSYPYPWATFSLYSVAVGLNYTDGLPLVSQVTWNPKPVSIYGASRMNRKLGQSWVATMQVPQWGARAIQYRPIAMGDSGKKKPTIPALDLPKNTTLHVGLGKVPFYINPRTRRSTMPAKSSKPVHIGHRVRGLVFLQTLAGVKKTRSKSIKALRKRFRDQKAPYAVNVAFYNIKYGDGKTVTIPVKLGWNIHLWNSIYFRTRLMPGISGYWIGFHKTKNYKKPKPFKPGQYKHWYDWSMHEPDVTLYAMPWVNPRPDVPIASVMLVGAEAPAKTVLFGITAVVDSP